MTIFLLKNIDNFNLNLNSHGCSTYKIPIILQLYLSGAHIIGL